MKLSTKGRYGLRAMVDIAVYSQDSPVPISAIAERQNISVRYLEQLLPKLKKAGIIKSIRGAQGGYMLDKDPKDISAGDILRTLEGDLTPIDCAAFTGDTSTCSGTKFCVTKTVWKRINDSVQQAVDSITLQELMEESIEIHTKYDQKKGRNHNHGKENHLLRSCCYYSNKTGSCRCNASLFYRKLLESIQCIYTSIK